MAAEVRGDKSSEETIVHTEEAEEGTAYDKHTPVPPGIATADDEETIVKPLNKHTP
jgi:hypothetical protein